MAVTVVLTQVALQVAETIHHIHHIHPLLKVRAWYRVVRTHVRHWLGADVEVAI